jgi:structural maintenance of chromosome 4
LQLIERQAQLEAEQKQLEGEAEKVVQAQQQAKAAAEKQEAILKNITKEHNQLKELVNTVRSVELDLATSFDEFTKVYRENEVKKTHWSEKLKQIRAVHAQETREQNQIARSLSRRPETSTPSEDGSMEIVQESVALDVPISDGVEWNEKDENLPDISPENLPSGRKVEELKREINLLESERDKQKGNVNLSAIEQFREKMVEYRSKLVELEEVTVRRDTARKAFDDLRKQRLDMFMQGFGVITLKLKEMYQMITLGGDAELELVDSLDPFSEGIVFSVRPPKKSWKNISNLSGKRPIPLATSVWSIDYVG